MHLSTGIRYIKQLKKGVPFFESSPMLNDISQIPSWSKVASGLLRMFDGEVLQKRQVVQHFVFGTIFSANWIPAEDGRNVPTDSTFRRTAAAADSGGGISSTTAPWARHAGSTLLGPMSAAANAGSVFPMARAPWIEDAEEGIGGSDLPPVDVVTRAPWATTTHSGGGAAAAADGGGGDGSRSPGHSQQHPDMPPPPTRAPWAKR